MAKVLMYTTWITVLIVCGSAAIESGVSSITQHMLEIENFTK
jgi:hypothetical protein